MNKKIFAPLVIMLIILGVIVVGGAAWYLSSRQIPPPSAALESPMASTAPEATADWPVHTDTANGFAVKYPADFPIEVSASKSLSVDLPGTFGGSFNYQETRPIASSTAGRIASENAGNFIIDYWAEYGGMGSWDTVINAWTKNDGRYYIISLNREFISGVPGNTPEATETALISKALSNMRDDTDTYVHTFQQILSTFRLIGSSSGSAASPWTSMGTTTSQTPEFFDKNVSVSKTYLYKIVALDNGGSGVKTYDTVAVTVPAKSAPGLPLPPTVFNASRDAYAWSGGEFIDVKWDPLQFMAFNIYRATQ